MKVVPFKVPQTRNEAFRLQIDSLHHFYDRLHQHDEHQIMWIQKSEGTLIIGDYVGRFKEDDVFLLGGNQAHVFRNDKNLLTNKKANQAKSVSIYFNEMYMGQQFWELTEMQDVRALLTDAQKGIRINDPTKTLLIAHLKIIKKSRGVEKLIHFFQMIQLILKGKNDCELLSVLSNSGKYSTNEGKRMNDILQFTFTNSHRKIYIEEVAQVANLSTEAFCRYFKTRTMKTYTTFLNEVRVSQASRLLINNRDKSISEICFETGFSNISNFNRVFKRITGKTPSQYI
jgi:AraC-like DNA-binding protein